MSGFPVNKKALEKWLQGSAIKNRMMYSITDLKGRSLDYEWGYEKEIDQFRKAIEKVKIPSRMDREIVKIIVEESGDYFEGKCSVVEATDRITRKVKIYRTE